MAEHLSFCVSHCGFTPKIVSGKKVVFLPEMEKAFSYSCRQALPQPTMKASRQRSLLIHLFLMAQREQQQSEEKKHASLGTCCCCGQGRNFV
jgi:hypothetical protein